MKLKIIFYRIIIMNDAKLLAHEKRHTRRLCIIRENTSLLTSFAYTIFARISITECFTSNFNFIIFFNFFFSFCQKIRLNSGHSANEIKITRMYVCT